MLNIQSYGGGGVFRWDKNYFLQVVTAGSNPIVSDPLVINALKQINREDFVPEKLRAQAYDDVDLDIGYNEKLARPIFTAHMLNLMKPQYGGKYLDIGTGTGYMAMLLGFIAGETGKVYTIERIQWFWEQARMNAKKYENINNVSFLYRDGSEGLMPQAPFDAIRVGFAVEGRPEKLLSQLKTSGGKLVYPTTDFYVKVITRNGVDEFEEEMIPGFVYDNGKKGIA